MVSNPNIYDKVTANMLITEDHLIRMFPKMKDPYQWAVAINTVLPKYNITTIDRIAGFLSQCAHESAQFNVLSENLNYSDQALVVVFRKYFPTLSDAAPYHRQPEIIANKVYGNRMGNGDEQSGDGWKYRGRGVIQLTGRRNYQLFADHVGNQNIVTDPTLVASDKSLALMSAAWFWENNGLNQLADQKDVVAMTRRINGGTNGLDDRKRYYDIATQVLRANSTDRLF